MPGFKCKCGNIIKYGAIPNPQEWLLISDVQYDSFQGNIDSEELYDQFKSVFVCTNCERIWIFWKGFDFPPSGYLPNNLEEELR